MIISAKKLAEKADMKFVDVDIVWNVVIADDNGHTVYLDAVENDYGCYDVVFLDAETPGAQWGFLCQIDAEDICVKEAPDA